MKDKIYNLILEQIRENHTQKAIDLLLDIKNKNTKINSLLGVLLTENQEYEKAIKYLEEVRILKKEDELIYLSLYISYFFLNKHEMAFEVLFEYLENNKANLFRDTLVELLIGLNNGYSKKYKNKILYFAKKNNINI